MGLASCQTQHPWGSATCWDQIDMGLTSCQTQHPWVQLLVEPTYMWVWQATRPNVFKLIYELSPNTCESGGLWDLTSSDSTMRWSSVYVVLTSYENTWVWGTAKPNISGPNMLPIPYGYRTNNLYRLYIGLQDFICPLLWLLT